MVKTSPWFDEETYSVFADFCLIFIVRYFLQFSFEKVA